MEQVSQTSVNHIVDDANMAIIRTQARALVAKAVIKEIPLGYIVLCENFNSKSDCLQFFVKSNEGLFLANPSAMHFDDRVTKFFDVKKYERGER